MSGLSLGKSDKFIFEEDVKQIANHQKKSLILILGVMSDTIYVVTLIQFNHVYQNKVFTLMIWF